LEQILLPRLLFLNRNKPRGEIRIWSAACASGQEVYSLAILLEESKRSNNDAPGYRIFASDQSESQVRKAIAGRYCPNELTRMRLNHLNEWFSDEGDFYTIKPELKKNIEYSLFDLRNKDLSCPAASIFGDFDIVICANLFFYYSDEVRSYILSKITNCLADGGFVITGETERDILIKKGFIEVYPQSAIFRKSNQEN
jgi:chemotaxis methyl-accepting protein methylase